MFAVNYSLAVFFITFIRIGFVIFIIISPENIPYRSSIIYCSKYLHIVIVDVIKKNTKKLEMRGGLISINPSVGLASP